MFFKCSTFSTFNTVLNVLKVLNEKQLFMPTYRYIFDSKKPRKKFTCPGCGHPKVFTRYLDTITGEYMPEQYGKCDRDNSCTYHLNPYKDGYNRKNNEQGKINLARNKPIIKAIPDKVSFITEDILKLSLGNYERNNFVKFLLQLFGKEITEQLIGKYFIGTTKYWNGATVFWKIDILGRNTAGKIMLYNPATGKRIKEPFNHVDSVHNMLKLPEPKPFQCLFGEHLSKGNNKPVAIVESEKSAIIASVYFPEYIWLATGSLVMLTRERCKVLKGRNVTLFPDMNGFNLWNVKARELSNITRFVVSDLLEKNASEEDKINGLDLADYLIKFDYKVIIRDLFRAEFLKENELLPEYQVQLCKDYRSRGLQAIDLVDVINELINEHGFIMVD